MWDPDTLLHVDGWKHLVITLGLFWVGMTIIFLINSRHHFGISYTVSAVTWLSCLLWPLAFIALLVIAVIPRWRKKVFRGEY